MPKTSGRVQASSESSSPSTGGQLLSFFAMYGIRRDSGGSSSCTASSDRRDSTESRGSEVRRESSESERRISFGSGGGRDRRYSEGNERRECGESETTGQESDLPIPGKKKNSIFRQIMKWGSPRRNSKTSGGGKKSSSKDEEELDIDNNEMSKSGGSQSSREESQRVVGNAVIPIILERYVDETKVRYYNPQANKSHQQGTSGSKGVTRLNVSTAAPIPRRKRNSNSNGSASIPTEELHAENEEGFVKSGGSSTSLTHGESSCNSSGSFSTSGSESGTDEASSEEDEDSEIMQKLLATSCKKEPASDLSQSIPHRFDGSSSTYYSYYPDYRRSYQYQYQQHQSPQVGASPSIDCAGNRSRARSRSLDLNNERRALRRRRFSENHERAQDNSQTHKTYTIYESIIQEGVNFDIYYFYIGFECAYY